MYYELYTKTGLGIAHDSPDIDIAFKRRLFAVEGRVSEWPELRWIAPRPTLTDWVWTVNGIRLVSPTMREILDRHLGPADDIQWIPGTLTDADGDDHDYWVPHFPTHFDLLDNDATTWGPGGPIRWVLSTPKLQGHNVFALPKTSLNVLVHEDVLTDLNAAGTTGYDIRKTRRI